LNKSEGCQNQLGLIIYFTLFSLDQFSFGFPKCWSQ